ncbi:glycosyltransferase [uncultured Flavobacterium sp.]|uniref:glycosyltransferase n=1 Tax=uncultured Flavobacterium sp. TaxID=165435 RepID=UPI0030EE1841
MKTIYHIAESVANESGGLKTVVLNLNSHISSSFKSQIICNKKEEKDDFLVFPSNKFKNWAYSKELSLYLKQNLDFQSILHLHGVFMHAHFTGSKVAIKNNLPYVVSPHGMLEPWHLNDKKIKKSIYLKLFLNKIIKNSNVLHAITPFEKDNLYKLTNHKNIVEIPNLIHYTNLPKTTNTADEEDYFMFLGRIHPKKGLDILLESFSRIDNKKITLKIVGSENEYSNELKIKCEKLNISKRVMFLGGVFGDEKYNLLSNAKAFVAPSYSEAIGMVNLEAAACNTPVITSFYTGINPEWNTNGGIMINPNVVELTKALNDASSWSNEEQNNRGIMLSEYVKENYSWEKKGDLWTELYKTLN